ncbi:MAG TPA: response regulator [Synergistaceae bacterium]|nr:response regulator [Synergistaceae bacterium]HPJ25821.1 response regulator [Synergistaceae bacterium]HPQ38182.1 response regulator [Synergistaceae bacterium]
MNDLSHYSVLLVDDVEAEIDILVNALEDDYEVSVALDGISALEYVEEQLPDLILLDIIMPGMDGYEVCARLKENPRTLHIPIIFLTSKTEEQDEARGLDLGALDYITKPFNTMLVKARVRNHLLLKHHQDSLEEMVRERTRELQLTQDVTIEIMGTLAEYRDSETGGHVKRTKEYIKILAEHLRNHPGYAHFLNDTNIDLLYKSAPLHDIGKLGVPDSILLKPGKLTIREFEEMKKHCLYGLKTMQIAEEKLGSRSFLNLAGEIAYSHHEKWDGTGYPEGKQHEDIPLSGRLMAIADVYDALISKRGYKMPFSHEKAVEIIRAGKDRHFDPVIVDAFLELEEKFRRIALEFADHEEERKSLAFSS